MHGEILSSSITPPFRSSPIRFAPAKPSSHSSNILLIHILLEIGILVLPPFEKERVTDKLEPRCEFQRRIGEHSLESVGRNVSSITDFIHVWLEIDIGGYKEDVID